MKNKLYYVLFFVYAAMVAFVLYINGVFSAGLTVNVNLLINVGFLILIGILFVISHISFSRLNRCTDELAVMTSKMQEEYKKNGGKSLWASLQDCKDVFLNEELRIAFNKFRVRMKGYRNKRGYSGSCDIEEYINEDLLDRVGMTFFNSGMSGTLTGLGILGTFLGLSMGLGSFEGNDIYTISDNVGPLLSGMKVAFHTSVYGIFFSLIFNFVYRSIMADAYEKLEHFQNAFRQFAMPVVASDEENTAAMLIYQANTANALKQMLELMKGNSAEQTKAVEHIVNQFTEQMYSIMGVNFQKMGNSMKAAADAQAVYADNCRSLMETGNMLVEMNRNMQDSLAKSLEQQQMFARELNMQKEKLSAACDEMSDEISNQLYAFNQMRDLYEK